MMKAQVFLLVAVLLFGMVHAQRCFECSSVTSNSDNSAFANMVAGVVPCDEDYEQTTVDCSSSGGCLKADYSFEFDVEGEGKVSVAQVVRTCGAALDVCESATEQQLNAQRDLINAALPSTIQFVSGSGSACICSDNLCNRAHATTLSLGALLASVLVSYIAMKR